MICYLKGVDGVLPGYFMNNIVFGNRSNETEKYINRVYYIADKNRADKNR